MIKIPKYSPVILLLIFVICACESKNERTENKGTKVISASAKASKCGDGPVVISEPTDEELRSLRKFESNIRKVDNQFPRINLQIAKIKNFEKLHSILQNGDLKTNNGEILRLTGCECGPEYIGYLKKVMEDEGSRIYFIPSGFEKDGVKYAYIWCVDISFGNDISTTDIPIGPLFSQLNETMIINKWCKPVEQAQHKYHDRYTALSKVK